MKENDPQHKAFIKFAEEYELDLTIHPLHLLYLDAKTHLALLAFQAGYKARKELTLNAMYDNYCTCNAFCLSNIGIYYKSEVPYCLKCNKPLKKENSNG